MPEPDATATGAAVTALGSVNANEFLVRGHGYQRAPKRDADKNSADIQVAVYVVQ